MVDREAVRQASPLEEVIPQLVGDSLHGNGAERAVRCPFHDDRHPSLRINTQKQVWRCDPCDLGGDVFAFVRQFNKCSFLEALSFLAGRDGVPDSEPIPTRPRGSSPSGSWIYRRPDGAEAFKVDRFEEGNGKKRFLQSAPDGRGDWICERGCMDGVERWLYRVDHLGGQDTVCLVEGEKVADAMCALGIPTTTPPGGAGKWHTLDPTRSPIGLDGYAAQFVTAGITNVAIFPDNDKPGRRHAEDAARACHAAGQQVKVVTLPGLPPAGDVVDFLEAGRTKADVLKAITDAPRYEPAAPARDTRAGSPSATPSYSDEAPTIGSNEGLQAGARPSLTGPVERSGLTQLTRDSPTDALRDALEQVAATGRDWSPSDRAGPPARDRPDDSRAWHHRCPAARRGGVRGTHAARPRHRRAGHHAHG